MKIPFHINISSGACRPVQNHQKQTLNKAGPSTDKGLGPFDKLLKNSIESLDSVSGYPHKALPLNQDQAQKLYEIIQMRMNECLLSVLSEFDKNSTSDKFKLDWMNICSAGRQMEFHVSKSQQVFLEIQPEMQKASSRTEIENIIAHASKTYDVDPDLIKAVVKAESDFNVDSTSSKGAMGLMQLMPETAKELGVKNSYNPVENVMAGTRYLKSLLDRYDGNVTLALAAYNWGMGNVERHPERLPLETQTYIARINKFLGNKDVSG
ncbi:MAG: lytic transglycosylase domain-containing protein [Deltaproteobacteria bacterium]|nr:lytic transglycosylase domain-containing protein [Deltaproteobacteria bacterium]MBW2661313.1 lytic transglycosylase domain-containing protein [Deltaproteobacteria bacterium]